MIYPKNYKKSQIEMMGLVIIVIIIAVIALFAVKFMTMKPKEALPSIKLNIQANNMLNAILKANVNSKDIKTTIIDCCKTNNCNEAIQELEKIFNLLNLRQENINYKFQVVKDDIDCFDPIKSPDFDKCKDVSTASPYLIQAAYELYEARLALCKK